MCEQDLLHAWCSLPAMLLCSIWTSGAAPLTFFNGAHQRPSPYYSKMRNIGASRIFLCNREGFHRGCGRIWAAQSMSRMRRPNMLEPQVFFISLFSSTQRTHGQLVATHG